MSGKELASALVKMATSPVKADRDAIARIERECQMDITTITVSLENSELMAQALIQDISRKPETLKIFATGMFWGAVIGIAMLFVRPPYAVCGAFLGIAAGVSGRVAWTEK
ncbi:hypothetical protein BV372_08140 [Nostoc sp. T09]|uniref:hypothetical protein n=1 Tax=Nostoc sp. T09 TaxID=1932621 RepID=UPI000A36FE6E|nr:hypothetical protein [Nostoc sp. T09]OUL36376.1 hypothetical protein BV372_08140 [Nostoc sp. T09]